MMGDVVSIAKQAERKRELIAASLAQLRSAEQIDERQGQVDDWLGWYDETIGDCTQIEILAGAMRVELALRRGIAAGPAEHGGDRRSGSSVAPLHMNNAERQQLRDDRAIASEPEIVHDYITESVESSKVPSIRGALRLVKGHRAGAQPIANLHVHHWVCKDCGATKIGRPPSAPRIDPGAHPFGCRCSALCTAWATDWVAMAREEHPMFHRNRRPKPEAPEFDLPDAPDDGGPLG